MSGREATAFLRWAGGKALFAGEITRCFPPVHDIGTYYEPFLGAGSVFFTYRPARAVLSDLNDRLISTFLAIKKQPGRVSKYLQRLAASDSETTYYSIRQEYNQDSGHGYLKQAARFIYLNKTCFNGIFRVNQQGEFNVPYGYKETPAIPSLSELRRAADALQRATLLSSDYRHVLDKAQRGDFVYLDPPYPPLNGSSYFTHYTKERFSEDDQESVLECANELSRRGCSVLITNADTPRIRELYSRWNLYEVERTRWVTSARHKHKVGELIITNY